MDWCNSQTREASKCKWTLNKKIVQWKCHLESDNITPGGAPSTWERTHFQVAQTNDPASHHLWQAHTCTWLLHRASTWRTCQPKCYHKINCMGTSCHLLHLHLNFGKVIKSMESKSALPHPPIIIRSSWCHVDAVSILPSLQDAHSTWCSGSTPFGALVMQQYKRFSVGTNLLLYPIHHCIELHIIRPMSDLQSHGQAESLLLHFKLENSYKI